MKRVSDQQEDVARKAAQDLANAVNSMGFDPVAFADELCRQHRTLQQSAMRAFIAFIIKLTECYEKNWYDLRNEASACFANKVLESTSIHDRAMPLV